MSGEKVSSLEHTFRILDRHSDRSGRAVFDSIFGQAVPDFEGETYEEHVKRLALEGRSVRFGKDEFEKLKGNKL